MKPATITDHAATWPIDRVAKTSELRVKDDDPRQDQIFTALTFRSWAVVAGTNKLLHGRQTAKALALILIQTIHAPEPHGLTEQILNQKVYENLSRDHNDH